jgi:L-rhamnose-H+ transport protein
MAVAMAVAPDATVKTPMLTNYLCSALAGTTWYMQFFFYTMGETQMGRYKFSSWTLHMASIIIFSTLWGVALKEWNGSGTRTKLLVILSLLVLVTSTAVVGYGNYVGMAKLP